MQNCIQSNLKYRKKIGKRNKNKDKKLDESPYFNTYIL